MVDTPLKGQYLAVVDIVIRKGTQYYGGEFRTAFDSDTMSPDVKITYKTDKKVLTPSETFTVEAQVLFGTQALPGLGIVKANIYGSTKALAWNSLKRAYKAEFTAPEKEGIYLLAVYADGQDYLMQGKIYVADVAKAKSARCSMSAGVTTGCTDMKDVRRCAADWKSGNIALKEDQLVSCFESATGGMIFESVICGANKGDLDGDAELDTDDVDLLQNLILPLSPNARKDYEKCADYNLDGFVDNEDLKCLSNVVANKWYGDFNGGICLDAVYDSPLKGDLTGDKFVKDDDVVILKKLVAAATAGVKIPRLILDATDFNRDGKLTQEDLSCINYFVGMQFSKPETMLAAGQTIPKQCLNIYDLSKCKNIRGDLNGDLRIDSVDEILIMLVNAKQISSYKLACADVNKDGIISLEDVVCVKAYNSNERDKYFACIGCTENTPPDYREPYEVCGDGWDNDCDGLTDKTSTDALSDDCRCNDKTPCWMVQDADGGTKPGVNDGNVKVCRKVEWGVGGTEGLENNSGYNWMSPSQLTCQKDRECKSMLCAGTVYKCAKGAREFKWYNIDEGLPIETDDPNAAPKTCEDQYDNDCNCGDRKCAKQDEGESMFGSGSFWIGAIAGLALGWALGPGITLMVLSLASSVGGMITDNPNLKAFLSGFGLGLAVGGIANSALGGATPATSTTVGGEAGGDVGGTLDKIDAQTITDVSVDAEAGTATIQAEGGQTYLVEGEFNDPTWGSDWANAEWPEVVNSVTTNTPFTSTWGAGSLGERIPWGGQGGAFGSKIALGAPLVVGGIAAMMGSSDYTEATKKWIHTADCSAESNEESE
jgi:hypothetical protein